MNTREKILEESLRLFAEKGYDGVSVREIARAVGVRESALYKHFKNKEDILSKVIEETNHRISSAYVENAIPEKISSDIAKGYRGLSSEQLCEISWNLFSLFTKDPVVANYRKLLTREQYGNKSIASLLNETFLDGTVIRQEQTFQALVEDGFFRNEDPKIIALQFYGPILLLFQRYDCEPEKEAEIKKLLYAHVKAFGQNYGNTSHN